MHFKTRFAAFLRDAGHSCKQHCPVIHPSGKYASKGGEWRSEGADKGNGSTRQPQERDGLLQEECSSNAVKTGWRKGRGQRQTCWKEEG